MNAKISVDSVKKVLVGIISLIFLVSETMLLFGVRAEAAVTAGAAASVSASAAEGASASAAGSVSAGAAGNASVSPKGSASASATVKQTGKWVRKNGYYYYYRNKKKLKNGIFRIGQKKYCFDKKGRQRTGWRKIGKYKYYFSIRNGKNGYMLAGRKVDGVALKKNGRAAPKGERARKKLPILIKVQQMTDKIVKPTMSKSKKLKICFEYVKNHFSGYDIHDLGHMRQNWELEYAAFMLNNGFGDCYCYAATFAYFANAIGYSHVMSVNSGGHGWTEINGKFYDPNWANVIGTDKCYAVPASLSGVAGRPKWGSYGLYYADCDK